MIPQVKICCIANIKEAQMAINADASALGLVGAMPSGPGVISDEKIHEITAWVPPGISTFLLTSYTDAGQIIEHQRRTGTNTIQIVDRLQSGSYRQIRKALPGIKIVQVIHVSGKDAIGEACKIAPQVDAILLDSGNPNLRIKELGGTGRTHNWEISRKIRESISKPMFLAGGLTPQNVAEAIRIVEPFGVDVCSGVRTNGQLDPDKLKAFIHFSRG